MLFQRCNSLLQNHSFPPSSRPSRKRRPRYLSKRPLVGASASGFPGNVFGRFARASSSRIHLTTPVNYSYLLAPNSQLRGLQYNKQNTLIWAQHIERWLYQRLWRKMKTGTTMLIGVKSKKGPLFSMRLRDAINIQLIFFPPKVLLFHCLLTFASLIGGRSCYSAPLSSTDFPLCVLQIRPGWVFFPNGKWWWWRGCIASGAHSGRYPWKHNKLVHQNTNS